MLIGRHDLEWLSRHLVKIDPNPALDSASMAALTVRPDEVADLPGLIVFLERVHRGISEVSLPLVAELGTTELEAELATLRGTLTSSIIHWRAQHLIDDARAAGLVLDIRLESIPPWRAGAYVERIGIRPVRVTEPD